MPSEIATGLFTIAGTLIGSTGVFAANWLTARSQRIQTQATRRHDVLDRQYAEHKEYLAKTDRLINSCDALRDAVAEGAENERLEQLRVEYTEAWTSFGDGRGGPELSGPTQLLDPLGELRTSVIDYVVATDRWWSAGPRVRNREDHINPLNEARVTAMEKRKAYRELAVELLSPTT
ncbi:hypothetical protein [Nocardia carnea]|uniref:hypothetical protein n=1 Tax=Nocardia carnea TaxID=37328 RepID=UPI0024544172|nr:hypothetical protein [Nocardia carnea]